MLCLAAIVVSCLPSASEPPLSSAKARESLATLPVRMTPIEWPSRVGNANTPKNHRGALEFPMSFCTYSERVNDPESATRAVVPMPLMLSVEIDGLPAYHRRWFDHQPVDGSGRFTADFC